MHKCRLINNIKHLAYFQKMHNQKTSHPKYQNDLSLSFSVMHFVAICNTCQLVLFSLYSVCLCAEPSPPQKILVTSEELEGNIALRVRWTEPVLPNGVIETYKVFYKKKPWELNRIYRKDFCGGSGNLACDAFILMACEVKYWLMYPSITALFLWSLSWRNWICRWHAIWTEVKYMLRSADYSASICIQMYIYV